MTTRWSRSWFPFMIPHTTDPKPIHLINELIRLKKLRTAQIRTWYWLSPEKSFTGSRVLITASKTSLNLLFSRLTWFPHHSRKSSSLSRLHQRTPLSWQGSLQEIRDGHKFWVCFITSPYSWWMKTTIKCSHFNDSYQFLLQFSQPLPHSEVKKNNKKCIKKHDLA